MGIAARIFNKKQSLEREVKDVYAKFTIGTHTAPTITLDTTEPIVLTKSTIGAFGNSGTVTLQVLAAAANPTNKILVGVTGTAAAITITVTPNDGTNNAATPVDLTTEELVELLDVGSLAKVNLTDASSLLANIASATGGDTEPLADAGEGDGESGTWAGGTSVITDNSILGISSIVHNGVGDYSVVLEDPFYALKNFRAILQSEDAQDRQVQLHSESVATSSTKQVRMLFLTGATAAEPDADTVVLCKMELKNTSGV